MAYKIQSLVDNNYDFKQLYPDKQDAVRKATGMDFYLDSIVSFLQRQTNNFTIENSIAHDLDNAIYEIVERYNAEKGKMELPEPEKIPEQQLPEESGLEKTEEETRVEILEAIELLEMLGEDADEATKEALEILKSLV
jgi:hypothetical protein